MAAGHWATRLVGGVAACAVAAAVAVAAAATAQLPSGGNGGGGVGGGGGGGPFFVPPAGSREAPFFPGGATPTPTPTPTPSISPEEDAALARAACGTPYPGAATPPGYCAYVGAAGLGGPRGVARDASGDLLVVERYRPVKGRLSVVYLSAAALAAGGAAPLTVTPLLPPNEAIDLNHGVAHRDGWLYASNDTSIFRWPYVAGSRAPVDPASRVTVVGGMPGGLPLQFRHYTRTLEFGPDGSLFMSIGSRQTDGVDGTPWRSLVKRFSPAVVAGWGREGGGEPFDWQRGQTWALGLRNEVGIRFDSKGVLWGVENGQNLVVDPDLGGNLTADNPCEEINALRAPELDDEDPLFYGYPYCWPEGILPAPRTSVPGRQRVWPPWKDGSVSFRGTPVSEAWCQNPANVVPPVACLPAHWAPLGVDFQPVTPPGGHSALAGRYAFPASGDGDMIVLSHGSFDRVPPVGYAVARVPVDTPGGDPDPTRLANLFASDQVATGSAKFASGARLVDGRFYADGSFIFSSDSSGELIVLRYYR